MKKDVDTVRAGWLRRLARLGGGLFCVASLLVAALWIAAPRLAEWKLRGELSRLGVPAGELRVRSATPWALELEPLRLGADPDAPFLGTLRVEYTPREILRGHLRSVELDGTRLVIRRAKAGGWELAGAGQLLPKRAESATAPKPLSAMEILSLIPNSISVRGASVVVETENGRQEFPVRLNAVRSGAAVDVRLTAEGFGGKLEVAGAVVAKVPPRGGVWTGGGPESVGYAGNFKMHLPPRAELGGRRLVSPRTIGGTIEAQWSPGVNPAFMAGVTLKAESVEIRGDGWTALAADFFLNGGVDGTGMKMDAGLRGVSVNLADGTSLTAETMEFPLRSMDGGLRADCTLRNGSLRIPQAELEVTGADADLAVAWSEKEGLRAVIFEQKTNVDQIRSVKLHGLELGPVPLRIEGEGKWLRVGASVKPPESAFSAEVALSAKLETREVALSATVPPAAVTEKDPLLVPFLPAALKGSTFSGTAGGRADATWKPGGEPKCAAVLTLAGGRFATADGKFDAAGVECALDLESLIPFRSRPAQKLQFTSAHASGVPLENGRLAFRVDPPDTIFIEHGSVGWCGGKLTLAAARMTGGKPDGVILLRADSVDLGRVLGLMKEFSGHAEGKLTGRVPLIFRDGGMRVGDVCLFTEPGMPGLLHLDPDRWPGSTLDGAIADPVARKMVKLTLKDMKLDLFRLQSLPGSGKAGAPQFRMRLSGTPRTDRNLPPVDLEVNRNITGPLWELLGLPSGTNAP